MVARLGSWSVSRLGAGALPFDDEEQALLQQVAELASLALSNAQLLADLREEVEARRHAEAKLSLLASTSRELTGTPGEDEALIALMARRLSEAVGDTCWIALVSDDGDSFRVLPGHVYDADPAIAELAARFHCLGSLRVGEGLASRVFTSGKAVLIPEIEPADLAAHLALARAPLAIELGVRGVLVVPIRIPERNFGVIGLYRRTRVRPYTADDLDLVQGVADRFALTLTGLHARARERAAHEPACADAPRPVWSEPSADDRGRRFMTFAAHARGQRGRRFASTATRAKNS